MFNFEKEEQALEILRGCFGFKGIWASNDRYSWQCWTRDFIIAVLPYILIMDDDRALSLAKRHLDELAKRQKWTGQIPILFIDNHFKWLKQKIGNSIENRRVSFMLKRYFSAEGVFNLTPWTKDSEILYLIGVGLYYEKTGDMAFYERHSTHVDRAFNYIRRNLMYRGLVFGSDWRDTRPDHNRRMLLTNNVFLCLAYRLHGMEEQAYDLELKVSERFWYDAYFVDYIGTDEFDTFGNALMLYYDIASSSENDYMIFHKAEDLATPFGYRLNGVTLPPKNDQEASLMSRIKQNGVIWPYIHGFMILALIKCGKIEKAKVEFEKWNNLPGFYEFYDPDTGQGHGSSDQLWSATLYLRCAQALQREVYKSF